MNQLFKIAIYSLLVLFTFLLLGWHGEISLFIIMISSVVFGYNINMFMDFYRKFQSNIEKNTY